MDIPNTAYIDELAQGDQDFKDEIIKVIKKEFPEEKKIYFEHLQNTDFKATAEAVHKLKHKISILGLENGYEVAVRYENELRDQKLISKTDFEKTLVTIERFLTNLT